MQAFAIRHDSRMQIASFAIQIWVKHWGQTINKISNKTKSRQKQCAKKIEYFDKEKKIRFTPGKPSCKSGFLEVFENN